MFKSLNVYIVLVLTIMGCGVKQVLRFEEIPKQPIQQIPNEVRGAWVTASSWADANPDTMKSRITKIMKNLGRIPLNSALL